MSKISVLVVDDASFIRDLVKKCLRNYFPGIRTEDAINGKKAQAMLTKEAFDLVLCDWEMPEMSGLELLTWCREQDNLKTMPFIMVTSRGDKENVVQAIQAGVSGYVSKPFTNEQLLTKVKQALNKIGKLDALMNSAPTKMNSAFGNDSLSALTGGKAPVVAAPAPAAAPARGLLNSPPVSTCRFGSAKRWSWAWPIAAAERYAAMRDQSVEPQGSAAGGEAQREPAADPRQRGARSGAGRQC